MLTLSDSRTEADGKQKALQAEKSAHRVQSRASSLQRLALLRGERVGMVQWLQLSVSGC